MAIGWISASLPSCQFPQKVAQKFFLMLQENVWRVGAKIWKNVLRPYSRCKIAKREAAPYRPAGKNVRQRPAGKNVRHRPAGKNVCHSWSGTGHRHMNDNSASSTGNLSSRNVNVSKKFVASIFMVAILCQNFEVTCFRCSGVWRWGWMGGVQRFERAGQSVKEGTRFLRNVVNPH